MLIELLKAAFLGIVEGITEWLPVSSTGHMILVDEFIHLNVTEDFKNLFLVVIQLGAILAVVMIYWKKIFPFKIEKGKIKTDKDIWIMWFKVVVSCLPAAVVGILFDDKIDRLFYNWQTVSAMLIIVGIVFLLVENRGARRFTTNSIDDITLAQAFWIGMFQLVAAIFPGTSRSGATIIGGVLLGVSRTVAAEYTFFLAIPVMFGRSLLKILKFGLVFTGAELLILRVGCITAFVVSVVAINSFMDYIKKHDFKVFGIYRIILGLSVFAYFYLVK